MYLQIEYTAAIPYHAILQLLIFPIIVKFLFFKNKYF